MDRVDTSNATDFKISEQLKQDYGRQISDFSKSYSKETAELIAKKVNQSIEQDLNKEEMAREIRNVAKMSEWRVQRIARTETHRATGLAGVEAGVKIQNETGARIYKEWVTAGVNPCGYCAAMNGVRVNVTESYVEKGGILISKAKIRINDYADIDTAGAHPNCSCKERFGVEVGDSKVFDYSKLPKYDPNYQEPHEQDFYERLLKNNPNIERIPKSKDGKPTNDYRLPSGEEWELKSILVDKLKPFTVRNEIFKATDKSKDRIFIDVYNSKLDADKIVELAKQHLSIEKNDKLIKELIVVSGDKFTKIK